VRPLDVLLALSVPALWGLGFTFAKAALSEFPPILLMAMRFTLAALVLVWFVRPPWHLMRHLFWISLVGSTIQYSLTFSGLAHLHASTAILVVQLEVPFGALMAFLLLGERLGAARALGMALAFAGVALIAGQPRLEGDLIPLLMVVAGACTWAVAQVMVKRLGRVGGFTLIAWVAVLAAPQLYVASWIFEDGQLAAVRDAGWVGWGAVVYMGMIMTAVGYGIWYHVLTRHDVNQVMPFLLLLPVTAVAGGVVLLGETLTPWTLAGGAIVITGVAVIITRPSPGRLEQPPLPVLETGAAAPEAADAPPRTPRPDT